MLKVKDLHAGYGQNRVIKGVSFSVEPGEVVSLLGANGAGKTTLLKAICGLLPKAEGVVEFEGRSLNSQSADEVVKLGLCMVPEGRQTFGSLSVLDNLMLAAHSSRKKVRAADVDHDLAEVFGMFPRLKERRSQRAGTLSGGEGQMLAIGRALMCRPKLLMMDEPSLGLAPLVVQEIFDIVKRLRARIPILLVEQNALGALKVADRGIVLETGGVVLAGPAQQLLSDPRIQEHYLGTAGWRTNT